MQFLLDHATFKKHGEVLLEDVSLSTSEASYFVSGAQGSGKSLLLQALALKLSLVSGDRVTLHDGKKIGVSELNNLIQLVDFTDDLSFLNHRNGYYQQRYHVGMEGQALKLAEYLTQQGLSIDNPYHQVLLSKTNLSSRLDQSVLQLSNGQLAQMLFVKALLRSPKVLFMDNAFEGLDIDSRVELHETLNQFHKEFDIQFYVTGKESDIPNFISNEINLVGKRISYQGTRTAKESEPPNANAEENESLAAKIVEHYPGVGKVRQFKMVLEAKNVSVNYLGKSILQQVSFSLGTGSRVALFGKNGSGKSTLLSLFFADHPLAYSNEIYLFDRKRGSGESIWSVKKQIGFVSSELRMYIDGRLTTQQVIHTGFFDSYHPQKAITPNDQMLVDLLISYFGMEQKRACNFDRLSSGEKQVVVFIRAIVQHPRLLLLDEPYQGMDGETVKKCNYLLTKLLKESETSLLFVSHHAEQIPELVNERYCLENGKLVQSELT